MKNKKCSCETKKLPKTKGNGVKSATKEKSFLRKGKKRYAAQGGKPNVS